MAKWRAALGVAMMMLAALAATVPAEAAGAVRFFDPSMLFNPQPVPQGMTFAPGPKSVQPYRGRVDRKFMRQVVAYDSNQPVGTIIVKTHEKFLYLILGHGRALRYGIGTARTGFEWGGTHKVTAKREWPGWTPPAEMRQRQPYLPAHMDGGINNPLGARALYIGSTLYRIHGTNEPWTIGQDVSSGCIRMVNDDVIDLYNRVKIGAKVIVM
jgi:lipoprotein-anchoring transpeptidase ErfK/SrfK